MFGMPITIDTLKTVMTLAILAATLYGFVREKIPPDLTSLLALCGLVVTGVLEPTEAFAGFSHPATVSVAALLVLSAAVERSGLVNLLARRVLAPLGRSEFLLTVVLMLVVGLLSAFINNTAAVAIFIPVVLTVCVRSRISPGRVLMPMAHAATLGGMCTLIGTSTNLVSHEFAVSQGLPGFTMFELGQVGLPIMVLGFLYMLLIGRWFLPKHAAEGPDPFLQDDMHHSELLVQPDSPWIGREVNARSLHRSYDVELVGVQRHGEWRSGTEKGNYYSAGDVLEVRGGLKALLLITEGTGIRFRRTQSHYRSSEVEGSDGTRSAPRLVELVVLSPSGLVGQTLQGSRFAEMYDTVVLALRRRGGGAGPISTTPLQAGDVLVVEGNEEALLALSQRRGFLMVGTPDRPEERSGQLALTLATLVGVIAVVSFGLASFVTAAVSGCAVLMLSGSLPPREAYRAIDLSLVFTLSGSLALGVALEKTGITASVAQGLSVLTHPYVALVGFFLISVAVSEMMSNSGTVALLGPLAISTAAHAGINPMALLAAVTFGASAAFAMPVGYQTSLMIYGPGGYRFMDFVRMGVVLDLLVAGTALYLIPRYWPLVAP